MKGQVISGNNNPEVLKELKKILLKLHHLNAISIPAIKKYLKRFPASMPPLESLEADFRNEYSPATPFLFCE
jgi:hypothetical protein